MDSSAMKTLGALSPEQRKELVSRVSTILRQQMHREMVPPSEEIRGTWQNLGDLRKWSNQVDRVGTDGTVPSSGSQMAKLIDHTLLKPTATRKDILKVCEEAKQYGFASVCVNSSWVKIAAQALRGHPTMPIAVVGFPLGAMATHSKAEETRQAIRDGAEEIDMVFNFGSLKGGDFDLVYDDYCRCSCYGGARCSSKGYSRNNHVDEGRKNRWLYDIQGCKSTFCQDFNRFWRRRSHDRGCSFDALGCWRRDGSKGFWWST